MPQTANATADDGSGPVKPFPEPISISKPGYFSRKRLLGPVDKDRGDLALLAHSLVTGMVDAATFANWSVFVGMQTGNTVILGLSTADLPANPHAYASTLISLGSFLLGAFVTFRATAVVTPKGAPSNRLWLTFIYFIQAALLFIAAAIITANLVPHNRHGLADAAHTRGVIENIKIVALLPPLGFQSGMQIATSRLLGFNELPVNVLTSTYCDLMGDAKLFALHNIKRTRRAVAVVLLLVGAISSGWLMRSAGGMMSVLWVAGGIKFLVAVFTLVIHPAKTD